MQFVIIWTDDYPVDCVILLKAKEFSSCESPDIMYSMWLSPFLNQGHRKCIFPFHS